jgi:hypothetical protein
MAADREAASTVVEEPENSLPRPVVSGEDGGIKLWVQGVVMHTAVTAGRTGQVSARTALQGLARTLSLGALIGAFAGLLVGGVLGRLVMRLLAVTSGEFAEGGLTDDQAIVGEITLRGTVNLALTATVLGAIGGIVYLWVRRVLPDSSRGRILGFASFTGAIGGALFVHEHGSFDYTNLSPAWLSVSAFVALPLLFGVVVASLVEAASPAGGLGRRVPTLVLVVVALPALILTAPFIGVAAAVVLVPAAQRMWQSRTVTVAGTALYSILVLWGVVGIVADIVSIATNQPSPLPFNP